MLIGIISDIHGNLPALRSVLGNLDDLGAEEVFCAGDIVGYGANPVECVDLVAERATAAVAGNHEGGVLCTESNFFFNRVAREACLWTREVIGTWEKSYLSALPLKREAFDGKVVIVHAELCVPGLFDYLQSFYDVDQNIACLEEGAVCFFGHSHAPFIFHEDEGLRYSMSRSIRVAPGGRALVNVGSVGQPRDGDCRSSFATYDTEEREIRLHRIWYDFEETGREIRKAGLPEVLADRLRFGR